LTALGATDIDTYFVPKGENIHTKEATEALSVFNAAALIVLDQGSRGGPAILPGVPTLILDHHQSTVFPDEAKVNLPMPDQLHRIKTAQKCTELPDQPHAVTQCYSFLQACHACRT